MLERLIVVLRRLRFDADLCSSYVFGLCVVAAASVLCLGHRPRVCVRFVLLVYRRFLDLILGCDDGFTCDLERFRCYVIDSYGFELLGYVELVRWLFSVGFEGFVVVGMC